MSFSFSPNYTLDELNFPLDTDNKIKIFIDRVYGWQIQPALDMEKTEIQNRGFAQLAIVCSFFEMLGKYLSGYDGSEPGSGKYFKIGLRWIFSEIDEKETELLNSFYRSIRCGLYHMGITTPNVIIYDGIPTSFGFNEQTKQLAISPDRFVDDIRIRFGDFAKELSDPNNAKLRSAFVKCFDANSS